MTNEYGNPTGIFEMAILVILFKGSYRLYLAASNTNVILLFFFSKYLNFLTYVESTIFGIPSIATFINILIVLFICSMDTSFTNCILDVIYGHQ